MKHPNPDTSFTGEPASQPLRLITVSETAREALINEIVAEMKKDSLKETARARFKKSDYFDLISRFFQHPAILLLIGFAVTALIGGWLANRWQQNEWDRQQSAESKEWERQQLRLLDIHGIDTKHKLIDELTRAVGERNAAARAVLTPLAQGYSDRALLEVEKEQINNWSKVCSEWRVASQVLKLKVATHIQNQESAKAFDQIIADQVKITVALGVVNLELTKYNLPEDREARQDPENREARQHLDKILSLLQRTEQNLKQLVALIASEARFEIESGQ